MEGYFKIYRQLFDSWVFADEKALKIWVWLIGKARHKDGFANITIGKGQSTVQLKRGQLLFGRFSAEEILNLNGSLIYRKLQKFKDDGMILVESNSHYTIITICNYETYQSETTEKQTEVNNHCATIEQPLNNHCATIEQPLNTNKNDNKDNNEKNEKNVKEKKQVIDIYSEYSFFKDDFAEWWFDEFIPLKKRKKASVTDRALKTQLEKIKKFSGGNFQKALEILKKSCNSGWTDVYELKENQTIIPALSGQAVPFDTDYL